VGRNKYKILIIFTLCFGTFMACTKSNNPQPVTLNATENQLLGIWYIGKQVDTQFYYIGTVLSTDTNKTYIKTYTNYTSANYIEFKSATYYSPNVAIGNIGLQCIDHSYGLSSTYALASVNGTGDSSFWFYDNVNLMQLQIGSVAYYIVKLTSDSLVLWYDNDDILVGSKYNYNWCYLHR